jgi:hypothetical protein
MSGYMAKLGFLAIILLLTGSAYSVDTPAHDPQGITFFMYADFFRAANESDQALDAKFNEVFAHVGRVGPGGQVGAGLVFPYLTWTEGTGSGPYTIPAKYQKECETLVRVAQSLKVPLLVQFNGAVWHSPSRNSAFDNYWMTVAGGKYLSRYKDGRVNEAISETVPFPDQKLKNTSTQTRMALQHKTACSLLCLPMQGVFVPLA